MTKAGESSLVVAIRLPFAWREEKAEDLPAARRLHLGRQILQTCNELESMLQESEASPGLARVEAKLDLMLHWLGQSLYGNAPALPETRLWLAPDSVEWEIEAISPPQAAAGWIALEISPALPVRLELPARLVAIQEGRARAKLSGLDEAMAELWTQWLFRRHRRAIAAARAGGGANLTPS